MTRARREKTAPNRASAAAALPPNVRRPAAGEAPDPRSVPGRRILWIKLRIGFLLVLLGVGLVLIVNRAWALQVRQGDELRQMAEQQYLREVRLPGRRGIIYDRNGRELAVSVDVESVYANPREVTDPARTAAALAGALQVDEPALAKKLQSRRFFVWVDRRVQPDEAAAVRALRLRGVHIQRESRRFYPNRDLASHVLGFAGLDAAGLEGVELTQDEVLRGHGEVIAGLRDARGNLVFAEELIDGRRVAGGDVILSIDKTIQHIAEEELAAAMTTYEARAGSVVVIEPATGEVLAIANAPSFNPNEFGQAGAFQRRNRAVCDRFEPGSTIKIFTLAAALASGTLRPSELVYCEKGLFEMADYVIHDAHRDGWLTPTQVLARSSNIGAAKIALALGRTRLYQFFRRFGFGEVTGVPLPGETPGSINDYRRWRDADTASAAFGQGISMSSFQLTMAVAAVANGGKLMRPLLVKRILDSRGETAEELLPRVRRRVIPETTARLIADMLTAVTEDGGTGIEGGLDDYLVAGKTGTAQKADFEHGGYSEDRWLASFVGFVPADRPRLAMTVVIDEPIVSHYGGIVAAPVFRRIADRSLRYLGVVPSFGGVVRRRPRHRDGVTTLALAAEGDSIQAAALGLHSPPPVPAAVGGQANQAPGAEGAATSPAADATRTEVSSAPESPQAEVETGAPSGPPRPEDEVIVWESPRRPSAPALQPIPRGQVRVPDLSGMTLRQALLAVRRKGLGLQPEGTGVVVQQVPEATSGVPPRTPVRVRLETID
ncbi:MAG: PASTA domain-containing protein [Deltaproteobacteria bacterium]|nr:PASTA domain-containing protein [Deltaproteobacteria bacterium]